MGKPISSVAGLAGTTALQQSGPVEQSPIQSPTQSPTQSPVQSEPKRFWPPAYGWRLSALDGERAANNGWQRRWLEQGSAIAGGGPIDSVAALRQRLDPFLVQPNGRPHRR